MTEHVGLCEVAPRDGLQMAKTRMETDAKIRWIGALAASGLREIEVGSFVPARVIPQMADTLPVVEAAVRIPGLTVQALAPNVRGVQSAFAAGAHRISIPVSVSEGHSRANLNRSPAEQVAEVGRMIAWMKAQDRPVPIIAACSTAFGCSIDGTVPTAAVVAIAEGLVEAGADNVMLCDTVGYGNPAQIKDVVRAVRASIGPALWGLHLHDTCGLGIANALAGIEEGIRNFDASQAGLGGCPYAPGASGNIVMEDLVFMLESMGFHTGVDLEKLLAARALLREGLPEEPMHGQLPKAGIPRTFHPVTLAQAA
jgi:hydroxymethylglutaryl-CoA lyase